MSVLTWTWSVDWWSDIIMTFWSQSTVEYWLTLWAYRLFFVGETMSNVLFEHKIFSFRSENVLITSWDHHGYCCSLPCSVIQFQISISSNFIGIQGFTNTLFFIINWSICLFWLKKKQNKHHKWFKTQRATNPHSWETGTRECFATLLKKYLKL